MLARSVSVFVTCTTVLILAGSSVSAVEQLAPANQASGWPVIKERFPGKMWFPEFLEQMGNKFDCYFTFETVSAYEHQDGDESEPYRSLYVPNDAHVYTLNSLIAKLRRDFPTGSVTQDRRNRAVIHIISAPRGAMKDYDVDSKLDLGYSGVLALLPDAIGKTLNSDITYRPEHGINHYEGDFRTTAKVAASGSTVREILTDYVPLSRYPRLLWTADTWGGHGKNKLTWIKFLGPEGPGRASMVLQTYPPTQIILPQPFDEGEAAYEVDAGIPAAEGDAIAFIDSHMKRNDPLQVRWAMLYLGREKAVKGIPILLKYLDYQYTVCALPEEEFPGMQALIEMGKPGKSASLEAMGKEKNPRRLQLLCRVVLGVDGTQVGTGQVEAEILTITDRAQARRVRRSLTETLAWMSSDAK